MPLYEDIAREINKISPDTERLDLKNRELCQLSGDELAKLFALLPQNIKILDLQNTQLSMHGTEELKKIFSSFPQHLEKVILRNNSFDFPKYQLIKIFEGCPLRIKSIMIGNENINEMRRKHYWPPSYYQFTRLEHSSLLEKARCLLENYVATPWMRFFTGHWNRHHIEDVQKVIDKLRDAENPISSPEQLLEQLYAIKFTNPVGSLARRVSFIEYEIASNVEEMLSFEP